MSFKQFQDKQTYDVGDLVVILPRTTAMESIGDYLGIPYYADQMDVFYKDRVAKITHILSTRKESPRGIDICVQRFNIDIDKGYYIWCNLFVEPVMKDKMFDFLVQGKISPTAYERMMQRV